MPVQEIRLGSKIVPTSEVYAVTGWSAITPLANSVEGTWNNVINKVSGTTRLPEDPYSDWPVQIAGQVKGFRYAEYVRESTKELRPERGRPRAVQMALQIGGTLLEDGGIINVSELREGKVNGEPINYKQVLGLRGIEPHQLAVIGGTTLGGAAIEIARYAAILQDPDWQKRFSPNAAVDIIPDTLTNAVSMLAYGQGTEYTVNSACSSSANAVIRAIDTLRGHSDDPEGVRVAAILGVEAAITPVGVAAFVQNHALTRQFNNDPERASRPFDKDRSGFVLGEGGGGIELETLEHALNRGARIHGLVVGWGEGRDGSTSLTEPDGIGARRSMRMAQRRMRRYMGDDAKVDYVNAHATSTPKGDPVEVDAIVDIFGGDVLISSTKGQTTHLVGAGGITEFVISLKATQEGNSAPPCANLDTPYKEAENVNFVRNYDPNREIKTFASNSFAFGGHNVTLIGTAFNPNDLV